ncbi:MAG: PAS domain-containing protein [Mycobacteriaceae bacterium]
MSNPLQPTGWPSKLPSRAELPPQASDLLPSWDDPGTVFGVVNFDGDVVAVSDGYRKLFGWTPAELMSAPYWEFVHPEDQHPVVESLERLMQTSDVPLGFDLRMLCRDGTYLWTHWQIVADPTSELIYGVGEDRSDEMPPVQGRVHVGTWVRDISTGTVDWSDEVYGMFGLPVGTAVNDDLVRTLINPQDLPLVDGAWRASIADEDDHAAQFRVTRPDGAIRILRSTGRVTSRADGRPVTMRGLTMDITDSRWLD